MHYSIKKLILIPILTISVGVGFSLSEKKPESVPGTYPEHLSGAFTGGFGEQNCQSCHFDYDLNWNEGSLVIRGIPDHITAGKSYTIILSVERKDLGRAGFQMSARYPDGSQVGDFLIAENSRLMFTEQTPDSLQYVQHSALGTEPKESGKNTWSINWKAPGTIADSVIFNVASNAANGDQSEFGDWIYIKEITVRH